MSAVTLADIARAYYAAPDAPDADVTWTDIATIARHKAGRFLMCAGDPLLTPGQLDLIDQGNSYMPVWAGGPPEYWTVGQNCAFRAWHDRRHGQAYRVGTYRQASGVPQARWSCPDDTFTLASELAALHGMINDVRDPENVHRYASVPLHRLSALVTEIIGQYACFATSGTFPLQRRVHLPPSVVAAILAGEVTA